MTDHNFHLLPSMQPSNAIVDALTKEPLYTGDSIVLRLRFTGSDGSGINTAGSIFWLTFRKPKADLFDLQIRYVVPDNTESQSGYVFLHVPSEEMKKLDAGRYLFDLRLGINDDEFRTTIANTALTLKQSVTRK